MITVSGLVPAARKREISSLARQICKELGIRGKGLKINIVLGILRDCGEINQLKKDHYQIWLDKTLSRAMTCETLAHELQHVRQFLDGRLEIKNGLVYFEGACMSSVPYNQRPFELEARKVGRELGEVSSKKMLVF